MKSFAFPSTIVIALAFATLACKSEDPSDAESDTDSTDDTSMSSTTASVTTDSQGPGPETTATNTMTTTVTSNTDVTGDPTGPDDTSTDPDSSSGEPLDPPTEPEIMYERPAGAFFENITRTADGTLLVVDHTAREVLSMTPTGDVDVFAALDDWPFSTTVDADGTVVIIAHHEMLFDQVAPFVATNVIYTADGSGGADVLTEVPEATFINGSCLLEPGVVLGPDSTAATVWRIDVATGDVEPWAQHMLLSIENGSVLPGANGCKVHDGAVFVSNSDRQTIVRIPIEGGDAGTPAVYFNGPLIDDFDIAASGTIYATTHGNDVLRIATDTTFEVIASTNEGVVGNTALMFGGSGFDDETVYITTDGGLYVAGGNANQSGPARVVRVPVGESD
jgi:hypothetical protein